MYNFGHAAWYGVKDFFTRQVDHSDFIKVGRNYQIWDYDELCLLTALAGVHKHTFGVPGSIIQAIKEGRWKYHDLKAIEAGAPAIFANTNLSPKGQKLVLKMLKQGKGVSPQRFSREDAIELTEIMKTFQDQTDIKRDHVNF